VRANKGQHKNASTSPAPKPKPTKANKTKANKKQAEPEVDEEPAQEGEDNEEEDDEEIRCICGNDDRNDTRPFIACDACSVWQHNVCMGIPDDEDDVPEHYFCEQCRPEEHQETIQALQRGEEIWETRNQIYLAETESNKKGKNRKRKGRQSEGGVPGWLKKDVPAQDAKAVPDAKALSDVKPADAIQETSSKRKREDVQDEQLVETELEAEVETKPAGRQDKRRKSSAVENKDSKDSSTALVAIDQLPADRKKVAIALSQVITADVLDRMKKSALKLPSGLTKKTVGDHFGARIEYSLQMNHGSIKDAAYMTQFRALHANLKKNHSLIDRLLQGTLTPDGLATMSTSDMASEELQRERAELKEVLDRQAVAVSEEGPRYKQDHKGYHAIEGETSAAPDMRRPTPPPSAAVVAPSNGVDGTNANETTDSQLEAAANKSDEAHDGNSGQQFDMKDIWAKTAQSPTAAAPQNASRGKGTAARRSSSVQIPTPARSGAKDDPDVDRLLDDNDEAYEPAAATGSDAVVWRGKLIQNSEEAAPVLNARFVAGRDLVSTISWQDLLPHALSIDGRLQIQKAEDYLCGLRWSTTSDVSVLSLTPYDNADAFNKIFDYFHSRQRYAVVEKNKPPLVKEFYIIPVEVGANLPEHIEMLEHCTIKKPIEERLLLASLTVSRAPEEALTVLTTATPTQQAQAGHNGGVPPQFRQSISAPAGSPITGQTPMSPALHSGPVPSDQPSMASPAGFGTPTPFPPNPYGARPAQPNPLYTNPSTQQPQAPSWANPRVTEILGDLQFTPSAMQILQASPHMSDQQLQGLRHVLTENPHSRHDFAALTAILRS
jgi:hypothetical protein